MNIRWNLMFLYAPLLLINDCYAFIRFDSIQVCVYVLRFTHFHSHIAHPKNTHIWLNVFYLYENNMHSYHNNRIMTTSNRVVYYTYVRLSPFFFSARLWLLVLLLFCRHFARNRRIMPSYTDRHPNIADTRPMVPPHTAAVMCIHRPSASVCRIVQNVH